MALTTNPSDLVQIGSSTGHPVVDTGSPLTRLNYFDGKFLRAPDLQSEQAALLTQVHLASQAGGGGLIHGFDCSLASGDVLRVSAGLGFDWQGRPLLMTETVDVGIDDLIAASRNAGPTLRRPATGGLRADFADCPTPVQPLGEDNLVNAAAYYLIVLNHIEAYCGEEDVYGKLCSQACISDTARAHIIEGVEIRAVPISLALKQSSQPFDNRHLRSRAASALFERERLAIASLISRQGLTSNTWCLGAEPLTGQGIAIGLLGRSGTSTLFLDAWAARRERIDTPPRQYWAARMAMRSLRIYLAQINQFQCQLSECLTDAADPDRPPRPGDPCADERLMLNSAAADLDRLVQFYARAARELPNLVDEPSSEARQLDITRLERNIEAMRRAGVTPASEQILIDCGIVELPSAGYLPVAPTGNLTVNDQVQRLLGAGVDLRFCVVRPDFVPHALEEAQHMERICLVTGLDDPSRKPEVDILVPAGELVETEVEVAGTGYEMTLDLSPVALQLIASLFAQESANPGEVDAPNRFPAINIGQPGTLSFSGAARGEQLPSGGFGFHFAGAFRQEQQDGPPAFTLIELLQHSSVWLTSELDRDPFSLARNESARVTGEFTLLVAGRALRSVFNGDIQLVQSDQQAQRHRLVTRLSLSITATTTDPSTGAPISNVIRSVERLDIARVSGTGARPSIEIEVPSPRFAGRALRAFNLSSERRWSGAAQASVQGALSRINPGRPTINPNRPAAPSFTLVELDQQFPLFAASQTINPAVLAPSHSAHESAITAVRAIASALGEPQFEEIAVRRLFPPPKPGAADVKVRATRDWVLFHRRRVKNCGDVSVPEPKLRTRNYRTYLVNLPAVSDRDGLHSALANNDGAAIQRLNPTAIGVVEFAAGLQTLESPADVVRAEWRAKAPGSAEIVYGAVASTGEVLDEGAELSRARLANLGNVLSAVTPLSDDPRIEVLSSIPDAAIISAAPHDGVMVIAAAPVATVCHQVFRLQRNAQQVARVLQRIARTSAASVPELLIQLGAQPMGQAVFEETGTEFLDAESDDIAAVWTEQGDGEVNRVILVNQRAADPAAPTQAETQQLELFSAQSLSIARVAGGAMSAANLTVRPPEDEGPLSPCPAITILVNLQG